MRAWLACALVMIGCYRSHAIEERDASLRADGGRDASMDAGRDAGSIDAGRDAGMPDAGHDAAICEDGFEEEVSYVCNFDRLGALPAGEPTSLYLWYSTCGCPPTRRCAVRVTPGAIALDTQTCPHTAVCDECSNEGLCEIPPLAAGEYDVSLDGVLLARLSAEPRAPDPVSRSYCVVVRRRGSVGTAPTCSWPPEPSAATRVCHRTLEDVGTFVRFELDLPCTGACRIASACVARLIGHTLHLEPSNVSCLGGTCPACALRSTATCASPPLRDGDYDIVVEGTELRSTVQVRDVLEPGPMTCVGG